MNIPVVPISDVKLTSLGLSLYVPNESETLLIIVLHRGYNILSIQDDGESTYLTHVDTWKDVVQTITQLQKKSKKAV